SLAQQLRSGNSPVTMKVPSPDGFYGPDGLSPGALGRIVEQPALQRARAAAVTIGSDTEGLLIELQHSFTSVGQERILKGIDLGNIRVAVVEDPDHLGIPIPGRDASAIANQIPVIGVRESDGTLTLYMTSRFRQDFAAGWAYGGFAELLHHE